MQTIKPKRLIFNSYRRKLKWENLRVRRSKWDRTDTETRLDKRFERVLLPILEKGWEGLESIEVYGIRDKMLQSLDCKNVRYRKEFPELAHGEVDDGIFDWSNIYEKEDVGNSDSEESEDETDEEDEQFQSDSDPESDWEELDDEFRETHYYTLPR